MKNLVSHQLIKYLESRGIQLFPQEEVRIAPCRLEGLHAANASGLGDPIETWGAANPEGDAK